MLDPVVTTALGVAFNEFLKSGAGELGKKATGKALVTIDQEDSAAPLPKLETYC